MKKVRKKRFIDDIDKFVFSEEGVIVSLVINLIIIFCIFYIVFKVRKL